jgi:hypothetical protein
MFLAVLFVGFGACAFGYVVVPVLFPSLAGTPALWVYTTVWSLGLVILFYLLTWRMQRTVKKK